MMSAAAHQLRHRFAATLLAVAMMLSPGAGQILAAEICASRCSAAADAEPACCAKHPAAASDPSIGNSASDPEGSHLPASDQMCPGCNGRPLIATTERLDLSLNPLPNFLPPRAPLTTTSQGVPFAVFHPPRA